MKCKSLEIGKTYLVDDYGKIEILNIVDNKDDGIKILYKKQLFWVSNSLKVKKIH